MQHSTRSAPPPADTVRAIGVDFGEKRIGIALSDSGGMLATPYDVVHRSGDKGRDHREIQRHVIETEAEAVVVGLPMSLDGSIGPAAQGVLDEISELRIVVSVPIETYDERFTTVTAEHALRQQGVRGKARRSVVDQVAAAVMLQSWLDAR